LSVPSARCGKWNSLVRRQLRDGRIDTDEAELERAELRAKWRPHWQGSPSRFDRGRHEEHADTPYDGRVVVLVSRSSVSSGESAAHALASALGATVVGERTGGWLQYTNAPVYLLPHTGMRWALATKRNYFDRAVEGLGIPVDYYLNDIEKPASAVVPLLQRLE
jgi:hypothetical protein